MPQDHALTAEIYQWFHSKEKNNSASQEAEISIQQSPTTKEVGESDFASAVDHFRKGHFVLVSGESLTASAKLETLACVPWVSVYDFDMYSRKRGLLSCVENIIKKKRYFSVCTWQDPSSKVTESGTQWHCLKGLSEIADSKVSDEPAKWFKETKTELNAICRNLANFANFCTVLKIVILWPEDENKARYVYKFLSVLNAELESFKLIIVCSDNTKTQESKSYNILSLLMDEYPQDAVKFTMHLDQLCIEVENISADSQEKAQIKYTLPTEEGHSNHYIHDTDAAWLRENLDVLYEQNPFAQNPLDVEVLADLSNDFFHGGTLQWTTWYALGSGHLEVERDIMICIKDHIKKHEGTYKNVLITLFHAPGGGGTTFAQRILWEYHNSIPCVEVKTITTVEGITEKIKFLYEKTKLPVLMLVDGEDKESVNQLVKHLHFIPTILLYIKRYSDPFPDKDICKNYNTFWLKGSVTADEANKLAMKFADRCDDDGVKKQLFRISKDVCKRAVSHYVYEFGMTVYDSSFKGIGSFVRGYLCLNKNPSDALSQAQTILAYLSLVYYYGHSFVPCQFFGHLLCLQRNYVVDMEDFPHPVKLFVVQDSHVRSHIRICHQSVAKEVLEHVLNPSNKDPQVEGLSTVAKKDLKKLCVNFIKYASHKKTKSSIISETIRRILTQTFIHRDSKHVDKNKSKFEKKDLFSRILTDVDNDQPYTDRLEILKQLTESFPEDPDFQAHLGRFYLYCRPNEDDEAEVCFKRALELCRKQIVGKDRKDLRLMRIYHMYGMIFKKRMSCCIKTKKSKLRSFDEFMSTTERIITEAQNACEHFRLSRERTPLGRDNYALASEIMVRLDVCDFIQKNYKHGEITDFLSQLPDHKATKFIQDTIFKVENLLRDIYSVDNPNIIDEYRKAYIRYQEVFRKQIDELAKLFQPNDCSSRRFTIAAIKLKYLSNASDRSSVFEGDMSKDDVEHLVSLYENGFQEADMSEYKRQLDMDYIEWLFAVRNPVFQKCYSVEKVLKQIRTWNKTVHSPSSLFYLFICTSLVGFGRNFKKGNFNVLKEAKQLKDDLLTLDKSQWRPQYLHEWVGKDDDGIIKCLITNRHVDLRNMYPLPQLAICKGTICHPNTSKRTGYIDLDLEDTQVSIKVFFIPSEASFHGSRFAGERVQFYLSFTFEHGYQAFRVLHENSC